MSTSSAHCLDPEYVVKYTRLIPQRQLCVPSCPPFSIHQPSGSLSLSPLLASLWLRDGRGLSHSHTLLAPHPIRSSGMQGLWPRTNLNVSSRLGARSTVCLISASFTLTLLNSVNKRRCQLCERGGTAHDCPQFLPSRERFA